MFPVLLSSIFLLILNSQQPSNRDQFGISPTPRVTGSGHCTEVWSFGHSEPGFSQRIRSLSQENRASFTQHGRERPGRPCRQTSATAGHHRGFGRFREFSAFGRTQGTLEAPGIPPNHPLLLHITSRGRNECGANRVRGSVTETRDEGFPTSLNSGFHPNTTGRNQNNLVLNPKIHHPTTKPKTSKAKSTLQTQISPKVLAPPSCQSCSNVQQAPGKSCPRCDGK